MKERERERDSVIYLVLSLVNPSPRICTNMHVPWASHISWLSLNATA